MLKKITFTILLSLVLSTFHFTPAQAAPPPAPIGNRDCASGDAAGPLVDGPDGDLSTYFVSAIVGGYEITDSSGVGCEGTLTIAPGVTFIGNNAFEFTLLTSVTIPNSVTTIGSNTFEGTPLTSITIPNSVTSIGAFAFSGNSALFSVAIPNSVTTIGDYAFSGNTSLTTVTIGNSVKTIGDYAFSDNTALFSLTIGSSVTSIGDQAFSENLSLTTVTIPDSVITIGAGTFSGNTSLETVTIGNSVTTIGDYAFYADIVLTSITIPDSVITIGAGAFQSNGLTSVTIGNSVETIGRDAFLDNSSLTSVTIPDSVITIGAGAFSGNTLLASLIIGSSVTSIGDNAFYATPLTSVAIPNSVITIGTLAFGDIPAFTLTFSSETVAVNTAAIGFTIANLSAGVNPSNPFSINATPPGMNFDPATGALTGTPSTAASATAYTVTATTGSLSASTIFTLTVLGTGTAPAAPTLNSVTGGNKQLSIAFTSGGDGGAAITDYEYSLNGGAYISAGTTTSPFTITALSGRTAYSVTIKARNSLGLSTASSSLSATTTDSSLDANEAAAAEAARVAAAAKAAANDAAAKAAALKDAAERKLRSLLAKGESVPTDLLNEVECFGSTKKNIDLINADIALLTDEQRQDLRIVYKIVLKYATVDKVAAHSRLYFSQLVDVGITTELTSVARSIAMRALRTLSSDKLDTIAKINQVITDSLALYQARKDRVSAVTARNVA